MHLKLPIFAARRILVKITNFPDTTMCLLA